jgi:hypothetical protein
MVAGLCGDNKSGQAIGGWRGVPGQTGSNPVKPGQSEKNGLTVKPQGPMRALANHQKAPQRQLYELE